MFKHVGELGPGRKAFRKNTETQSWEVIRPVYKWCEQNFGKEDESKRWVIDWNSDGSVLVLLKRDDDAFHFKMRWC